MSASYEELHDIQHIPQDVSYFQGNNPKLLLISQAQSQEQTELFREKFFHSWKEEAIYKKNITYFKSILDVSLQRRGYAENLKKWSDRDFKKLARNARYDYALSAPEGIAQKAIIIQDTDLRSAPTKRPYFKHPRKEGDAYPFDLFQNSSLSLGMAVKVFHTSSDKKWYYVEHISASGWVFHTDLAIVDDDLENLWRKSKFVAIIKDDNHIDVKDVNVNLGLGSVLPLLGKNGQYFKVAVPYRSRNGQAKYREVLLDNTQAVVQPLALTEENITKIANPLMGNPYGWGGILNNRDCSSTLQDVFTPFGLFLPRNSRAQSVVGEKFSIKDLSNRKKKQEIIQKAIPFQSFIFLPGHIALYLGTYKNEPVIFHNVWGVRLENDGRHVIGKTAITGLEMGKELPKAESLILERVQSFNIFID